MRKWRRFLAGRISERVRRTRSSIGLLLSTQRPLRSRTLRALVGSSAQLNQDVVALIVSGFALEGRFVEVGALDGQIMSNTVQLERDFDWTGILVECNPLVLPSLRRGRSSFIETRCAWSTSGDKISFLCTQQPELSTVPDFVNGDAHGLARKEHVEVEVDTIRLTEVFAAYGPQTHYDFLSIDTEGSEMHVLSGIDFGVYTFSFICVETANSIDRCRAVDEHLAPYGYSRVCTRLSAWDSWYIHDRFAKFVPDSWRAV